MTLSLKSISDFSRRRAMFVSAHKVAVYHWHKGDLASSYLFDVNEEGRKFFGRYLRETPAVPTYLLVDVFEEEFRKDTIPHVFGSDRASIIERRKARLFRDTPYYCAKSQGREVDGREDDLILISAITNPKLISPWVGLLEEYKIPLTGIYSVPLLTESMLKLLPDQSENNLIVSIQSISGLRQTFIREGQLRVSRLVQLPRYGTEPYAPHIREEIDKIRRYLNSLRLVPANQSLDSTLNIYFLMAGDVLEDLKKEYKDALSSRFHFLDINDLLQQSGSARRVSTPFSDQLFVHQLLKKKPANAYARGSERRYNTMRTMRLSMLTCSAVMLIASALWSGYTFIDGLSYRQQTLSAQAKTEFYTDRYNIAREGLPQTPVEPADLKVAVELFGKLVQYKSTPLEMIRLVSSTMNRYPAVRLQNFEWMASIDPNSKIGSTGPAAAQPVGSYSNINDPATSYDYYQVAVVDAEVSPFDGNYRTAISLINEFAEMLRSRENVHDVSILSLPLDISSEANMSGNTRSVQRDARFSLRVVVGIRHEV